MASCLDDSSLFMEDLFPLKEEEGTCGPATTSSALLSSMDVDMFPSASMELVQLLDNDDMFMLDTLLHAPYADGCYSPLSGDDASDALTDVASEVSSPPPSFDDDQIIPTSPAASAFCYTSTPASTGSFSPATVHASLVKPAPVSPPHPTATPSSTSRPASPTLAHAVGPIPTAMLPFAFPVACFPPVNQLNVNQKRPLPEVLPNALPSALDVAMAKKSKREIRQMKNRESANRSRQRRKAQLSEMSTEVEDLMAKQHELQNTIAALQAENKSLHDQNAFLRSLVTMYSGSSRVGAVLPPVPSYTPVQPPARPHISLSELEDGQSLRTVPESTSEEDDEVDVEEVALIPASKKRKSVGRSAATISAATLGLCASVFGLTILTDSENGATQSGHIRRTNRVLHSLPATTNPGCSPRPIESMLEWVWEMFAMGWSSVTSSELAYGVFLNVLSFVVIMGLYHVYQQYFSSQYQTQKTFRWESLNKLNTPRRSTAAKRRSVSWQDVRLQHDDSVDTASETASVLPRVQVYM